MDLDGRELIVFSRYAQDALGLEMRGEIPAPGPR